jgi:hypothetical protein
MARPIRRCAQSDTLTARTATLICHEWSTVLYMTQREIRPGAVRRALVLSTDVSARLDEYAARTRRRPSAAADLLLDEALAAVENSYEAPRKTG